MSKIFDQLKNNLSYISSENDFSILTDSEVEDWLLHDYIEAYVVCDKLVHSALALFMKNYLFKEKHYIVGLMIFFATILQTFTTYVKCFYCFVK